MVTSIEKQRAVKKKDLYIAYFVLFIDNFGWAIVFPLFSPLILDSKYHFFSADVSMHLRELFLALLLLAYPLTQLVGAPFFGDFADRLGRKKAFIFTLTGVVIGFFFSALFLILEFYIGLLLSRLFTGFFSGNTTISYATIADFSQNKKERVQKFALGAVFAGLGWVGAMFLGTVVFRPIYFLHLNPSDPFWVSTIFSGVALLAVIFIFSESHFVKQKSSFSIKKIFIELKFAMSHPHFRVLLNAFCCRSVAWTLVISWIVAVSLKKYDFSEELLRYFLITSGLVVMGINLLIAFVLAKRFSIFRLVTLGFLGSGIGLFLTISSGTSGYVIFYLMTTVFSTLSWSIWSLISLDADPDEQGLIMGVLQSLYALGMIVSPLFATGLSLINLSAPYYFSGALFLLGFCILIFWNIRHKARKRQH